MSYRRAEEILPAEVIELIQKYIDGENIYIPRKGEQKTAWGMKTGLRQELRDRDKRIYEEYRQGISAMQLAERYFLSVKSIQRIVRSQKQAV